MSYILDALKKAESERNRQSGPVLMDVRIASPRRRLPLWAWVIGAVLLTNMLVLTWLLLRKPAAAPAEIAAAAADSAAPAQPAVVAPPLPQPVAAPVVEPAVIPPPPPPPAPGPAVLPPVVATPDVPVNVDSLPTMQDLIAGGVTLPALQLNLHVYDETPGNRFVLLNSKRLREGDELPDGTRLERITPRGAVLNAHGRRFLLVAGG